MPRQTDPAPTRHFVYVLRCRGDRLYCGYTTDPERRFQEHCEGKGARFTRAFPPEVRVACVELPDRSSALRQEAAFKALTRSAKLAWINSLGASTPEC